jgi:rubrerythrin
VADALRLAIVAELDAISLHHQLAKYVYDERVRMVFEDVGREEKAHFGSGRRAYWGVERYVFLFRIGRLKRF